MDTDSNVKVTWSSHLFDVIKIRKRINILPLKVELGMDWNRVTREYFPFASVRDRILNGEITIEPHAQYGPMALYRRHIAAPGIGRVNVRAGLALNGLKGRGWHPFLGIGYGLRTDTTLAQLTSEGIDFRVRAPLHRHLKFDVCGNVKLPFPEAEYQFDSSRGDTMHVGKGELSLNIAQLDPVIYV